MWGEAPETDAGRSPLLTAAALGVWCVVWEAVGRAGVVSIVPPLSRVVASGVAVVTSAKFASAAWISLRAFALGMALAIVVGIPVGILMARSESVGRILRVWVNVFVSAPVSALVPLLMAVWASGRRRSS